MSCKFLGDEQISRIENILQFVEEQEDLKLICNFETLKPVFSGAVIENINYKIDEDEIVLVILTRGKTCNNGSPTSGKKNKLYVERWVSYLEEGLYGTPFILEDIFGEVVVGEEDKWMTGVMELHEWTNIYKQRKVIYNIK